MGRGGSGSVDCVKVVPDFVGAVDVEVLEGVDCHEYGSDERVYLVVPEPLADVVEDGTFGEGVEVDEVVEGAVHGEWALLEGGDCGGGKGQRRAVLKNTREREEREKRGVRP